MGLRLAPALGDRMEALQPDLRAAAGVIGIGLKDRLAGMRPAVLRAAGPGERDPDAVVQALDLDREGAPDGLSLAACLAAHAAYVGARDAPGGVSLGALALMRLLIWSARAAMLGPAPTIVWLGPPGRAPELAQGQVRLGALCRAEVDGAARQASAVAILAAPAGDQDNE